MRQALNNENSDLAAENSKYVMRITGDNQEGKDELDNFIFPESVYPVIATTSKLMTTGVDAQTCKLIVLDQRIQSMTEFKQIIGRGTRINGDFDKFFFTIMDFKQATKLFADPDFDAVLLGKTQAELMARIHGRLPDGAWIEGVEVFRRLYSAVGLGWLVAPTKLPLVRNFLNLGYRIFARYRLRLTGRCDSGKCPTKKTA
jgi:hypothetical protein